MGFFFVGRTDLFPGYWLLGLLVRQSDGGQIGERGALYR